MALHMRWKKNSFKEQALKLLQVLSFSMLVKSKRT